MSAPMRMAKLVVTTKQGRIIESGLSGVDAVMATFEAIIDNGNVNTFADIGTGATTRALVRLGSIASVEVVAISDENAVG